MNSLAAVDTSCLSPLAVVNIGDALPIGATAATLSIRVSTSVVRCRFSLLRRRAAERFFLDRPLKSL